VVLLDRNPVHCAAAHAADLPALEGDALSTDDLEEAGVRYADSLLAITRNLELNELIVHRVRESFRVEHPLALVEPPGGDRAPDPHALFPGNFPGIDEANDLLRHARLAVTEYRVPKGWPADQPLAALPYGAQEFALLLARRDAVRLALAGDTLAAGDRLWCAKPRAGESGVAAVLAPADAAEPE